MLRGVSSNYEVLALVVSIYGLKVLDASEDFYEKRGLELIGSDDWSVLKRSSNPGDILTRCLKQLAKSQDAAVFADPPFTLSQYGEDLLGRVVLRLDRLDAHIETERDRTALAEVVSELFSYVAARVQRAVLGDFNSTPADINRIKAQLAGLPKTADEFVDVYDPTCGFGGALVAYNELIGDTADKSAVYYGQDIDGTSLYLCAWRLLLSGVTNFFLVQGDVLLEPKFLEDKASKRIQTFDIVFADPPFGARLPPELGNDTTYQRFRFGPIRGKSADFAFLQHVVASLNPSGRAVVTLLAGMLSRSIDREIRENMVNSDIIRACIKLPAHSEMPVSLPMYALVIDLDKPKTFHEKIIFIDSAKGQDNKRRSTIDPEVIDRIGDAYQEPTEQIDFCAVADIKAIREREYSLLPELYLPKPVVERPSVAQLDRELGELERALADERHTFDTIMTELKKDRL